MLPIPAGPQAAESLREIAMTSEHQLTHLPKNPFCEVCRRAKLSHAQHRRKVNRAEASSSLPELPPHFGGRIMLLPTANARAASQVTKMLWFCAMFTLGTLVAIP